MGHFSHADFDPSHLRDDRSRKTACRPAEPADRSSTLHDPPLHEKVVKILSDAGFPFLLIEQGQVVLSGFIVTFELDGEARVQWIGAREVNSLPYRRTFLGAYASTLRQAGLAVTYAENAGEPYLLCRSDPIGA